MSDRRLFWACFIPFWAMVVAFGLWVMHFFAPWSFTIHGWSRLLAIEIPAWVVGAALTTAHYFKRYYQSTYLRASMKVGTARSR